MTDGDGLEQLFRREWAYLVATLTRALGPSQISLVEDAVHEALMTALQAWQLAPPPRDPRAWLLATAKNRAIDKIRRDRRLVALPTDEAQELATQDSEAEDAESQLAMMLSICDERLSQETHVTLILRLLCGLSPAEIARAFLVDVGVVDRRLHRGKARLRELGRLHDVRDRPRLLARLPSVAQALYLLFNEGYQGSDPENALQPGLCAEALRLASLLVQSSALEQIDRVELHALLALFCFQAARLVTRLDQEGVLLPLAEQDRALWDRALIEQGVKYLSEAACGTRMTRWHLEAGIACEHALAPSTDATNWQRIVDLYDELACLLPNPVIKLNRALALAELRGLTAARHAIEELADERSLSNYPFYWSARADLESRAGQLALAEQHYERAIQLARNPAERIAYQRKLRLLGN
jgi:RNA polymerase sigma factor (sigma-70 family)